ncbi:MAG: PHP domain-containing protein, partial [Chloroflexota bacterium]
MIPYVELHCHTNFSMLDGASHPEDLVARAKELGFAALAATDHDGLYGAVRFWKAAREAGIRPILGVEFTCDGGYHLVVLAKGQTGYANLCRLVSRAQLRRSKGKASLDPGLIAEHAADLFCLSGCRRGEVPSHLLAGKRKEALAAATRYARLFGEGNFWIELHNHLLPDDGWLIAELVALADRLGLGVVATNNVHYALPEGRRLQDLLVCIKNRTTLDVSGHLRRSNGEYYLKSAAEMADLFARYPGAVANSLAIAERCGADLGFSNYRFPSFPVPNGDTPFSYLYELCQQGARAKYQPITPAVSKQLAHELDVIHRTNLAEYFLIVW